MWLTSHVANCHTYRMTATTAIKITAKLFIKNQARTAPQLVPAYKTTLFCVEVVDINHRCCSARQIIKQHILLPS